MRNLFFVLILSPLLTFIIHILMIRLAGRKPYQFTAMVSVLLGNIPILFICFINIFRIKMSILECVTIFAYCLLVYNTLAYVYFHIFNMSETARRIHILIELKKAGILKRHDIIKKYTVEDVIDNRVDRLLELKQLKIEDNKYKINAYFLLTAAEIYDIWRKILGYGIEKE